MKTFILLVSLTLIIPVSLFPQSRKEQNRITDTLKRKIQGIKFADLGLTKEQESTLLNQSASKDAAILAGVRRYLKDIGLDAIITEEDRAKAIKQSKSKCDFVSFRFEIGQYQSLMMSNGQYPFSFSFIFCDNTKYTFSSKLKVHSMTDYAFEAWSACIDNFSYKRKYNESERLQVKHNEIVISNKNLEFYLDTAKNKNQFEGIYQLLSSESDKSKNTLGIYLNNDSLKLIFINGSDFKNDWNEGELKGLLIKTMSENDFILKWYTLDKSLVEGSISFINGNSFDLKINSPSYSKGIDKYIRIK